jgi:Ulp1 family protease
MSLANDRTAKEIQRKLRVFFHENIQLIDSHCPQQKNGFDCGLYVIVIVEEFCRFVYEYLVEKSNDKTFFEKFMEEIHRVITADYINQRRKELKVLLESMSMERKK